MRRSFLPLVLALAIAAGGASAMPAQQNEILIERLGDRKLASSARIDALSILSFSGRAISLDSLKAVRRLSRNENRELDYVHMLGLIGGQGVEKDLRQFLKSNNAELRAEAVFFLSRDFPAGEAMAREYLADTEQPDSVRVAALRALVERGSIFAHVEALRRLTTASGSLLLECLAEIRRRPNLEDVPFLIDLLPENDGRARNEAVNLLREITGYAIGPNYKSWRWFYLKHRAEGTPFRAPESQAASGTSATTAYLGVRILGDRVAFVVDSSGSMDQSLQYSRQLSRGQSAVKELVALLPQLPPSTRFTVIFFSSVIQMLSGQKLVPKSDAQLAKTYSWLKSNLFQGETDLHGGLKAAFLCDDVDEIVLLSDGEPSGRTILNTELIRAHVASWNRWRNIRVSCISFGAPVVARRFLARLAQEHGGAMRVFE